MIKVWVKHAKSAKHFQIKPNHIYPISMGSWTELFCFFEMPACDKRFSPSKLCRVIFGFPFHSKSLLERGIMPFDTKFPIRCHFDFG
jgi:hypothetical protein